MIKSIEIENFKLFKKTRLSLKPLSLLTGLNGTGKSSIIQILLLLRQSHLAGVLHSTGLILKSELVELGTGKDIFNQFAGKSDLLKFKINTDTHSFYWDFEYISDTDILKIINKATYTDTLLKFGLFNHNFQYLNAEHIIPHNTYTKSEFEVIQNRQIGKRGEYAVHYLSEYGLDTVTYSNLIHPNARSNRLLHNVEAWLNEISPGVKVIVEDIKGLELIRLGFQYETENGYTNEYKPINVGFGITYALPVIVALLTAHPDKITIIENPESHIHPRGQSKIGELIALCASNSCQLIIETHSDHVLNGVRVAVKQEKIKNADVAIYYFDRASIASTSQHESVITTVNIDKNGELSEYPNGLLDEWSSQLYKLI
jgi:predicted ATPase